MQQLEKELRLESILHMIWQASSPHAHCMAFVPPESNQFDSMCMFQNLPDPDQLQRGKLQLKLTPKPGIPILQGRIPTFSQEGMELLGGQFQFRAMSITLSEHLSLAPTHLNAKGLWVRRSFSVPFVELELMLQDCQPPAGPIPGTPRLTPPSNNTSRHLQHAALLSSPPF